MKQYRLPVRANTPILLKYTYKNEAGAVIDLTSYDNVYLLVKMQGEDIEEEVATFVDKDAGQVRYDGYVFPTEGNWSAQFKCQIGTADSLYGEPVRFRVVKNVDDLESDDQLEY